MFFRILKSLMLALLMGLPFSMFSQIVADFEPSQKQGCIPLSVTYTNKSTFGGKPIDTTKYLFRWELDESQNTEKLKDKVSAMYVIAGKKTVTLTILDLYGTPISGATKTYTDLITVFPNPSVQAIADTTITCVNNAINFSPKNLTPTGAPIVNYMWDFGDGSNYDLTQSPSHAYDTKATYVATVFATDTNKCSSTKATSKGVSIIVNSDRPIADFTLDKDKTCDASLLVNATNSSTFANGSIIGYKWYFSDTTFVDTKKNTSRTFMRKTDQDTKTIILTVIGNNGCSSIPKVANVTLYNNAPKITITDIVKTVTNPKLACPGTINFSTAQVNNATYKWTVNGNTYYSSSFSTILTSGTYPIGLTVTNPACSVSADTTLIVELDPSFDITPRGLFICGPNATKTLSIIGSNVTLATNDWYLNNQTIPFATTTGLSGPTYKFPSGATYDIKIKVVTSNGCKDSTTFPQAISVYYPDVKFTLDSNRNCVPLPVTFTNLTTYTFPGLTGTPDFIKTVTWDFGDESPTEQSLTPIKHLYQKDGDFTVKMSIAVNSGYKECNIDVTHIIYAGTRPQIKIDFLDTVVCAGTSMNKLTNFKSGVWWSDKSSTLEENGSTSEKADSTFVQYFKVTGKRSASTPLAKNIIYGDTLHTSFNNSNINDTGLYYMTIKEFYNGCETDSSFNYSSLAKYFIHVQGPIAYHNNVVINCADPFKVEIKADTIRDATIWNFNLYRDGQTPIFLKKIPYPTKDSIFDFEPLGYGTGAYKSVIHAYNTTTNCEDSSTASFTITKPKAIISVADTTPCVNSKQELSHKGLKDIIYITNNEWKLTAPDGSIITSNTSTIDTPGNTFYHTTATGTIITEAVDVPKRGLYKLYFKITDINNCSDDTTFTFRAYQPKADFTLKSDNNCFPKVTFKDASTEYLSPILSREWYTNGDSVQYLTGNRTSVSDTYRERKAFNIKLKVTDAYGCSDSLEKQNGVVPTIPPAKIIPAGKVCLGTEAIFQVDSTLGLPYTSTIDKLEWDFGDGSPIYTATNFTAKHTYTKETTYPQVTVKSYTTVSSTSNVCTNADTNRTTDIKDASANFSFMHDSINCKVAFLTVKAGYVNRYKTVKWEETYGKIITFKGNISMPYMSFQNAGLHIVSLTTTSDYKGCEVDSAGKEYIIPSSLFKITTDKNDVCIKDVINFGLIDTMNIVRYPHKWTFGDGQTDEKNIDISHSYETVFADPKVKVSFVVTNGCSDFDTTTIVLRQVMANFDRGNNDTLIKGCSPFVIPFIDKSVGATSYVWNFGDGTTETTASPTHSFIGSGQTFNVKLNIQGSGCNDDITKTITTYENPSFTSTVDKTICQDSVLTIKLTPNPGTIIESWVTDPSIISLSTDNLTATVKPAKTTKYIINDKYTNVASGDSPCPLKDTLLVKVQIRPTYNGAPKDYLVYLFENKSDTLYSKAKNELQTYTSYSLNNDSLAGITYKWTPSTWLSCDNCANPTINVKEDKDVRYIVTMADTLGCFTEMDTLDFKIIVETIVGLPTAFTPNTDGKNDVVIPRGWGVKEFLEIDIFNRWGQLVYKTNDLTKGWDGTFNGHPQDPDTYAWTIRYKDSKDAVKEKKGYITLLR